MQSHLGREFGGVERLVVLAQKFKDSLALPVARGRARSPGLLVVAVVSHAGVLSVIAFALFNGYYSLKLARLQQTHSLAASERVTTHRTQPPAEDLSVGEGLRQNRNRRSVVMCTTVESNVIENAVQLAHHGPAADAATRERPESTESPLVA